MSGQEVFRVTTENAEEVCESLGLPKPLVMADAPDMIWTRTVTETNGAVVTTATAHVAK